MSESLSKHQLHELARHGAAIVVKELESQIAAIRAAFPDLGRGARATLKPTRKAKPSRPNAPKVKTVWTPAKRKAAAARMKKYWAARKAGQKK